MPSAVATTTTLDQLAGNILQRLQQTEDEAFWSRDNECIPAAAEAVNDLLLLVGRPTATPSQIATLVANSVWQPMPPGLLCVTDVRSTTKIRKTSLRAMDYVQASNGPDWTADRDLDIQRWGPVGLTSWFVWPAPTTAIQVTVAGVAIPVPSAWPFDPATQSPFHQELDVALEMYGAAYCRLKELGNDAMEGNVLRQQYLALAGQATAIDDRRDPVVFSQTLGVATAVGHNSLR